MEDCALIRRLVGGDMPQRQVARQLGVARATVARAVASQEPPKYARAMGLNTLMTLEVQVRALPAEHPEAPGTVLAERAAWTGSITWFREQADRRGRRIGAQRERCRRRHARASRWT